MGPLRGSAALALLAAAFAAQACAVPGDGTPLRHALLKVKYLAETEAWERAAMQAAPVQYVLSLDAPLRHRGRCYWPVEARSGGALWQRFYATAGGERLLVQGTQGKLHTLDEWRKASR
ncbi:MAG TPA: hypothetical protein VFB53_01590 [Burkholderiales bacterium]|nr:hypothetical protein [Burkholderiales bacterium]